MSQPRIFKDTDELQAWVKELYGDEPPKLLNVGQLRDEEGYLVTRYTYSNGMIVDGVDGGWLWYAPPEEE